jgi:sortase B
MRKALFVGAVLLCCVGLAAGGLYLYLEQMKERTADDQQEMKPRVGIPSADSALVGAGAGGAGGGGAGGGLMDFSSLTAHNGDIVAWLTVDGTGIDYPVTQAKDNRYYLTHTARNEYSKLGSVFLEFRNNRDFSDFNNVLYAHNMMDGSMFGQLARFKDRGFFESHGSGTLYTPDATYRIEAFACAVTESTGEYYRYAFPSTSERADFVQMLRDSALNWRDVPVDVDTDRLLVLSTCSSEYREARTVLVAKLVPTVLG